MRYAQITTARIHFLLILLILILAGGTWAGESETDPKKPWTRFAVGVDAGLGRFDTNFNFINKDTGRNIYMDGDGTLGLPEYVGFPFIYGLFQFIMRHSIAAS